MSKLQYHKSEQRAILTGLLLSLHRVNLQDKFPRIAHGALAATLTVTLSLPVTAVLQTINTEHACIVASQPEMQDNGTLVGSRQPGHVCGLQNKIARLGGNTDGEAIVAMSSNFQDTLSVSSYAYSHQTPACLGTNDAAGRFLPQEAQNSIVT